MLVNAVSLAADRKLTDDFIISQVLLGKTEEYEILVRRYNSMLYRTARGILTDEEDIEDVMQEAYLRGFEKLHQFRREARFSTWLTRILINCALRHFNKVKGKDHLPVDSIPDSDLESLQAITEQPDPEIGENLKKALEGAINQLPPKYRVVFVLREIEHLAVADVSTILSITEENVKIRLHRAKRLLRDVLRSEVQTLDIFELHATRCTRIAKRAMEMISKTTLMVRAR